MGLNQDITNETNGFEKNIIDGSNRGEEHEGVGFMEKRKVAGEKVIYPELSYQIMNLAYEVHNHLGPGFSEDIYEKALTVEFAAHQILFEEQKPVTIAYKGQFVGNYRLDLVIDCCIILELKAVSELSDLFKQQVLSYLRATGLHLGILINFGSSRLQSVRIVN